jgi:hypothetical protein
MSGTPDVTIGTQKPTAVAFTRLARRPGYTLISDRAASDVIASAAAR